MKKLQSLILAILWSTGIAFCDTTYSGTTGDCTWALDTESGVLEISGSGAMGEYSSYLSSYSPWYSYRSSIHKVIIGDGVTNIGRCAFYDCQNLTIVNIPNSVTIIDYYAFQNCLGLTSIVIPDGVTNIKTWAFYDCSGLTSVTIGSGVTSIGTNAFGNCENITSVSCLATVPPIAEFPSSIYPNAKCTAASNLYQYAEYWKEFSTIELLDNAEEFTSITGQCGDDLTYSLSISDWTLVIEGSGDMYDYSYSNDTPWLAYNSLITNVTISDNVTGIGEHAFNGCSGLSSVTIPDAVTSIGEYAFYGCSGLSSVTIPDAVTSIGEHAFNGCSGLSSVTIPDAVTSIGNDAFNGCSGLISLTIGSNVASIGAGAFSNCTSLTDITSLATTPPTIGNGGSFSSTTYSDATLAATSNLYQYAKYWKDFTNSSLTENSTTINEQTGTCGDNLTWTLSVADGTLVIEGSGDMYDFLNLIDIPWYAYLSTITNVIIFDEVTSIGDQAFRTCSNLTTLTTGSKITSIGDYAFSDCSSLTSVTIPDAVTEIGQMAFYDCSSLTSATIGNSVTSIGMYAFYGCTGLTSMVIPESVTSIGSNAFETCENLTSITCLATTPPICRGTTFSSSTYANATLTAASNLYQYAAYWKNFSNTDYTDEAQTDLTEITGQCGENLTWTLSLSDGSLSIEGSGDMYDYSSSVLVPWNAYSSLITNVTISDNATGLSDYAFYNCTNLESITIPETVTNIGTYTFYGCSSLTSVTIPDAVTSVGKNAFYNCTSLTSVELPSGLTSIGNYAFYNCSSLTSITIPDGVTSIGSYVFYGCTNLASVELPDVLTSIDDYAFYNCKGLESIVIGDAATSIGDNAFYSCTSLASLTIGSSVTSIGDRAFYNCSSLTSVTIPDAVTSIDTDAFNKCSSIASLTIGSGVTSIGTAAFSNCSNLSGLTSLATTPPTCSGDPFSSTTYTKATLTAASNFYQYAPYWEDFTSNTLTDNGVTITELSGMCGENLTWSLSLTEGTLVISGSGDMYSYALEGSTPWYNFGSVITSLTISDEATSIGACAFYGCPSLESINIPEGVTDIGIYAFYNCSSLTSITIPEDVTSIGKYTFYGCSNLTSVTIPEGVTNIGEYAFYNCSSLESIELPSGLSIINDDTFRGCSSLTSVTIPDGITTIEGEAFYGCTNLSSIIIPESVTILEEEVFYNCASLTSVELPEGLTSIANYAFSYCSNLTSVTIPDGVTSINNSVFRGCTSLASVTIGSGVTKLNNYAFYQCTSLSSITCLASTPPTCGSNPFSDSTYSDATLYAASNLYQYAEVWKDFSTRKNADNYSSVASLTGQCGDDLTWTLTFSSMKLAITGTGDMYTYKSSSLAAWNPYGSSIKTISIASGATSIGAYAFYECSGATSLTIPSTVTTIGNDAFGYCSGLTTLSISSGVTTIGNYAFENCTSITTVTIPDGVTSLGSYAFDGCSALTSVSLPAGITEVPSDCFRNCTSLTSIIVPDGYTLVDDYAFYGCTALADISLPSGLTEIGDDAFYNCTKLTSVWLPSSVTTLGRYSFYGCTGLASINIPDGITSIPYYCFRNCSSLESITLPSSVTLVDTYAFYGCTGLEEVISYNTTPPTAYSNCFSSDTYSSAMLIAASKDYTSATCWKDFTNVAYLVVEDLSGTCGDNLTWTLTTDGVLTISGTGDMATYSDDSVTPWSSYYYSINTIVIDADVTSLSNYAFSNLYNVTDVYSFASTPPTIYSSTFNSTTLYYATLHAGSSTYASTTYWKKFSEISEDCGTCGDNLYWIYSDATLTIYGTGAMDNYAAYQCPWYTNYGSTIKTVVITDEVTTVGAYAFYGLINLNSVYSYNTTPPTARATTFDDDAYTYATLYAASEAYSTANYWKNFGNTTVSDDGNAVEDITVEASTIRATGSAIVITTGSAQTVRIVALSGKTIAQQAISEGTTRIEVATGGIYIVALTDGTREKVLVK